MAHPPPRRHRLRYFGALARWPPLWDQPLWDQRDVADTFDTDELILIPKPPEFPFDQRIDW